MSERGKNVCHKLSHLQFTTCSPALNHVGTSALIVADGLAAWFCGVPVRLLREELQLLQEQGSYVGEVVRAMDKKKVLVKVSVVIN